MKTLQERLVAIGLGQYVDALQLEGFETWREVMDITESDLEHLGIKLGHRRRLQRAIQDDRLGSGQEPLPGSLAAATDYSGAQNSAIASVINNSNNTTSDSAQANAVATPPAKRKYRRHPKPDENAPTKPPSAYVIFASRVREQIKHQGLSFSEVAKLVGERWQGPDASERALCEEQARQLRIDYTAKLAAYKETREYSNYQRYLADFKARHGAGGSKSSRLSFETPPAAPGTEMDSHADSESDLDQPVNDGPAARRSTSSNTNLGHSQSMFNTASSTSFRPSRPEDRHPPLSRHSSQLTSETYETPKVDGYRRAHSGRPWELTPDELEESKPFAPDGFTHDRVYHGRPHPTVEDSPSAESFVSSNIPSGSHPTISSPDMSNRMLPVPTGLRILPRPDETYVHDQRARTPPTRLNQSQPPPPPPESRS